MSTTTVCAVCEAAAAGRTCTLCGSGVCGAHFDTGHGCCVDCLEGLTGAGDVGPGDAPG
ncbi:MAG: hypothetical protein A07HB70_02409 [uncultured archaeon A07HB70]|nr:MAG: hypothetical protein A07HB70_02409 [uncultured archaeon A07HB70]